MDKFTILMYLVIFYLLIKKIHFINVIFLVIYLISKFFCSSLICKVFFYAFLLDEKESLIIVLSKIFIRLPRKASLILNIYAYFRNK